MCEHEYQYEECKDGEMVFACDACGELLTQYEDCPGGR